MWIDIKEMGISKIGYKRIINKYPVIKELEDFINNYNDFMESEYNSCECEGCEIFKSIFYLLAEYDTETICKNMWDDFRFGLAHINLGNYRNPIDEPKTDLENINELFKNIEERYYKE